jgi:hypothetical protein
MSDRASGETRPVDWNHFAELHRIEDGGGVLSSFKAIQQGTLAELVGFVACLPEEERRHYFIEKTGDHRYMAPEIMMLARRSDFPRRAQDC